MKRIYTSMVLGAIVFLYQTSAAQDTSIIYFDFDRHNLSAEAVEKMNQVIRPNLVTVKIFGHTDQLGSHAYNERLSEKRAQSVKAYLISKGISPQHILVVQGFGELMPAIAQLDAVSRQANRRVMIVTDYEVTAKDSVIIDEAQKVNSSSTNRSPVRKPVKENLISEITDTSTKAGDNLVLPNINFYGGRHVFLPEAYPALHELLNAMQSIPTLEIEIQGHICCLDSEEDGLDIDTGQPFLSYNRAKAVYEYLIAKGIDRKRMTFKGFGHKYPIIAYEETEAEKTINRRVEIKILKK